MPDFRAYCRPPESEPVEIRLPAEESHHLITVNRCGRGDSVVVFDGHGREWITECIEASKSAAILRVKKSTTAAARPATLTLAQVLPKGATMDDIVRQATEVGAARIIPLLSERTQVQLEGERAEKKVEKWRTTAIEAAKQCGNPWLPEIAAVQNLSSWLITAQDFDLKLIASLHAGATPLPDILHQYRLRQGARPRRVLWLIGPEGDFSPSEMTQAITHGFLPITLGPLVLRSDTAAIYALSILSHELQK